MNEYTAVGGVGRAHSDNGNLLSDGRFVFQWDYRNRLIAVFRALDMQPVAEYSYDAKNRRTRKRVYSASGPVESVTQFLYDGWTVCEEQDETGNTLVTYVYGSEMVTYVYGSEMDEVTQLQRTAVHPLGAGTVWLHQNVRGDVVAATSDGGAIVERRFYDDYGNVFDEAKQPVVLSIVGNPYGFQGRRLDAETSLYYFRNRYYSAETGRFLQRDPVWDAGNVGGQYTFVGCGPVSRSDPMGLKGGRQSNRHRNSLEALLRARRQRGPLTGRTYTAEEILDIEIEMMRAHKGLPQRNYAQQRREPPPPGYRWRQGPAVLPAGRRARPEDFWEKQPPAAFVSSKGSRGSNKGKPKAPRDRPAGSPGGPDGPPSPTAAPGTVGTQPQRFMVRRFMSRAQAKKMKRHGMKFDPEAGEGISTTTTNFNARSQGQAQKMTGATSAEVFVDINATGMPRGAETRTRGGLPEYNLRGDITREMIVRVEKVPK